MELEVAGLNLARRHGNIYQDLLLRLAVIKFLREELNAQYTETQERCRSKLRALDGPTQSSFGLQTRERFVQFQLNKRTVLRKCGEDLYEILREIEKETVAPMRRSMFAESESSSYELFINRLIFSEGGGDDFLKAQYYVMLGNFDRDIDRLSVLRELDPQLPAWRSARRQLQFGGRARRFFERAGKRTGADRRRRARCDGEGHRTARRARRLD